jgi:hypothetical protein
MVDTPWTFAVIFIAIFGVLIVFAFIWLTAQFPGAVAEQRDRNASTDVEEDPGAVASSGEASRSLVAH